MKLLNIIVVLILMLASQSSYSLELKEINAEDLQLTIAKDPKQKIVFLFTSWCSFCKKDIAWVSEGGNKGSQYSFYAISLDEDKEAAKTFFSKLANIDDENSHFFSLIDDPRKLNYALGIKFKGSIPYIAVFDDAGKLQHEHISSAQMKYLLTLKK